MKQIATYLLLFTSLSLFAQKEDYIWLGGYDYDNDTLDVNVVEGYRFDLELKKQIQTTISE